MTTPSTLVGSWPHGTLSKMQRTLILRRRLPGTVLWLGPYTRR
ncbi:hypothetical protein [Actinoallomurus rhizosphaericola]|nr:hypothetical protein [Actinoallomurus rhizosphaericola]